MVLKICKYGEKVLREKAQPVAVVTDALRRLAKGEVSEFARTGARTALLVVCEDRVPGDAAKAALLGSQVRDTAAMPAMRSLGEEWLKWNLSRLGFVPNEYSSVDEVAEEE